MVISKLDTIVPALAAIVGPQNITPLANLPLRDQHHFQLAVTPPPTVEFGDILWVTPATDQELAKVMACAYRNNWKLLICGGGSKVTWGGVRRGIQMVVSTLRLGRLIDHAVEDLTVTVEAGTKLTDLQAMLAPTGQFLATDPFYSYQATIGGIIATADTGALRQRYGGIRDMLLGISFVRSDGQLAKAGGRVVKNVAGYDLMKLMTGSYGTLGAIVQATFRLYPLPPTSTTLLLQGKAENLTKLSRLLMASALTPTAATLVSGNLTKQLAWGEGITLLVRFQGLAASVEEQIHHLKDWGQTCSCSSQILLGEEETARWKQLQESMEVRDLTDPMIGKMGVLPTATIVALTEADQLGGAGFLQLSSGLGWVQFPSTLSIAQLMEVRAMCQANGGFLSILQASPVLKPQMDVWGYSGNALDLMQRLKHQFDPKHQLSPGCFVNGL